MDRDECLAHSRRGSCGAQLMACAVEQQKQRVAAEPEQTAAVGIGNLEQRREGRVHDVGHLFGSGAAPTASPTWR
ncbi:MAG TPA: hypothetical protein VF094_06185 [Gaiellaceae bacterium]